MEHSWNGKEDVDNLPLLVVVAELIDAILQLTMVIL